MVKNSTGGNKHKKQARKNFNPKANNNLRVIKEDGEQYACVLKLLGNGMCHVLCMDSVTRLCIIRNKFRGRSRRDNTIAIGTYVMIGLRGFESVKKDKLENCDLLEVYSNESVKRLKDAVIDVDWNTFKSIEMRNHNSNNNDDDDDLGFVIDDTGTTSLENDIINNINNEIKNNSENNTTDVFSFNDDEDLNIDDI